MAADVCSKISFITDAEDKYMIKRQPYCVRCQTLTIPTEWIILCKQALIAFRQISSSWLYTLQNESEVRCRSLGHEITTHQIWFQVAASGPKTLSFDALKSTCVLSQNIHTASHNLYYKALRALLPKHTPWYRNNHIDPHASDNVADRTIWEIMFGVMWRIREDKCLIIHPCCSCGYQTSMSIREIT
jgi:hypothetical protein